MLHYLSLKTNTLWDTYPSDALNGLETPDVSYVDISHTNLLHLDTLMNQVYTLVSTRGVYLIFCSLYTIYPACLWTQGQIGFIKEE
jgi:hypothetical protein